MAARKIKNQPASLIDSPIAIYFDSEYGEYQVKIKGKPNATYFTDDKDDAFSTAQAMRNEEARIFGLKKNPAPKRKTAARTQRAAEGYVRRPSQITKKAPSKRLKKRRTINLQVPRGVFPNPSPREVDDPYAREIFLYGQNDGDLYRQQTTYIIDNLAKKYAAGKYEHELGRKAWKHWADNATKKYAAEYGLSKTGFIVNVPTRQRIAELAEDYYFEHVTSESVKFVPSRSKVKVNPITKEIVIQSSQDRLRWKTLARFPDTKEGQYDALEYASAYAKKEPRLYIQVTK